MTTAVYEAELKEQERERQKDLLESPEAERAHYEQKELENIAYEVEEYEEELCRRSKFMVGKGGKLFLGVRMLTFERRCSNVVCSELWKFAN